MKVKLTITCIVLILLFANCINAKSYQEHFYCTLSNFCVKCCLDLCTLTQTVVIEANSSTLASERDTLIVFLPYYAQSPRLAATADFFLHGAHYKNKLVIYIFHHEYSAVDVYNLSLIVETKFRYSILEKGSYSNNTFYTLMYNKLPIIYSVESKELINQF